MRYRVCVGLIGALAATGSLIQGQQQGAPAAPPPLGQVCVLEFGRCSTYGRADIDYGLQLYTAQCSGCHAPTGNGVPAVDLRSGQFRRASTDTELKGVITNGVPNTPMPPHTFTDAEFIALVAYLRNMRGIDLGSVTIGDPTRGSTLFEGKGGCASCHRVKGHGSRTAPDLSTVGARRPAAALERALVDPSGAMLPSNRSIRAVTKEGKLVRGRRLNEDTYTVQLIDDQEHLVSLDKAGLREYSVLKESQMPSYAETFSAQERADVLAYLLSLKGIK